MKISSLFTRLAQLNLFGRRPVVKAAAPVNGADTFYVTHEPLIKRKVTKQMIGAPSFGDARQGKILASLLAPKSPPSVASVQAQMKGVGYLYTRQLANVSYAQHQWLAWNKPELGLTLHLAMQCLEGAAYPSE